jgi:hypothetical protein
MSSVKHVVFVSFPFEVGPGTAAVVLGFLWPLYEYLRGGNVYYHPGILFEKDFTEYANWYFEHKIYKNVYWNLDAYLSSYFQINNELMLEKFFEDVKDVPGNSTSVDVLAGRNVTTSSSTEVAPIKDGQPQGNSESKSQLMKSSIEQVIMTLITDMIERNPNVRNVVKDMTGGDTFRTMKDTLLEVMKNEFSSNRTKPNDTTLRAKEVFDESSSLDTEIDQAAVHRKPAQIQQRVFPRLRQTPSDPNSSLKHFQQLLTHHHPREYGAQELRPIIRRRKKRKKFSFRSRGRGEKLAAKLRHYNKVMSRFTSGLRVK